MSLLGFGKRKEVPRDTEDLHAWLGDLMKVINKLAIRSERHERMWTAIQEKIKEHERNS